MVPGDRVVIVDDVITSGGSMIKAIERSKESGLDVVAAVALVDRQEDNGTDNIKEHVSSLFCITDAKTLIGVSTYEL